MPNTRTLQRSFGGGEISPEMYGRIDDVKYQTGLATCRNFIPKPQGVVENRSGTSYVQGAKYSSANNFGRQFIFQSEISNPNNYKLFAEDVDLTNYTGQTLAEKLKLVFPTGLIMDGVNNWEADAAPRMIPFSYNTTQAFAIEMGAGYFRFFVNGVPLTVLGSEVSTSPATGNMGRVTSSLTMANVSGGGTVYPFYQKLSAGTINSENVNLNNYLSLTVPRDFGNATYVYTYEGNHVSNTNTFADHHFIGYYSLSEQVPVECTNPYSWDELADVHYVQSGDVVTFTHPNHRPYELRRLSNTQWAWTTISFGTSGMAPSNPTATASGHTTGKYDYTYVITSIAEDEITESSASNSTTANGNLLETGGIVTIAWNGQASYGIVRYNVYKLQGGLFGYIGSVANPGNGTNNASIIDDNILPDLSKTPPNWEADILNSTNNYPQAVSYHEQRRAFAGTNNDPQKIWFTKSGTESNMSYSLPINDDDRIAFKVAAREANTILHIVPLTELLLLTSSAEWRVTSVNTDALTPTSISVRPQSYVGSSNVTPVIINNTLVYGASRGGHIRELGYNFQANGFITGDLSLRAPHLFDNYTITDMAYQKAPLPIVWFISSNGRLLGLTYVPEQQIGAWHWHDTTHGIFNSVTVIPDGIEDHPYFVTTRQINGEPVRFIERLESRNFVNQEEAWFVDAGATFDGTKTGDPITVTSTTGGFTPSDVLQVATGGPNFTVNSVNDAIILTDSAGIKHRLLIIEHVSSFSVYCHVDYDLPAELQSVALPTWVLAQDTISGITWLEGEEVSILADGAVHPKRTVLNGSITLDRAVEFAIIGLPIEADVKTLPLVVQTEAFGQGRVKNINKVWLRVNRSSGIFIGPDEDNLTEYKQRTNEPYGSPPALKTQEISVLTTPQWDDAGTVFVRQSDPLPLAIVSLTTEVSIGG